ncbi:putative tetratricopeptide-like helical domain superfamily [Helianthus annuus]|nr:putative tetratricopeptide-like helical domain superfamily [Helianthus annuus]
MKHSTCLIKCLLWLWMLLPTIPSCGPCVIRGKLEEAMLSGMKNCNRILKMLRGMKLVRRRNQVYSMMNEYGIKPNIITYNTLLDSYCKEGDIDQALHLLEEMQVRGCAPNDVMYNALINGLLISATCRS